MSSRNGAPACAWWRRPAGRGSRIQHQYMQMPSSAEIQRILVDSAPDPSDGGCGFRRSRPGGSVIEVDANMLGEGDCRGDNPGSVTLRYAIANSGRLVAEVRNRLFVRSVRQRAGGGAAHSGPPDNQTLPAQSIRTVTTTMSCNLAHLRQQGGSLLSEGGSITIDIQTGGGDWVSTVVPPEKVVIRCRADDDNSWPLDGYTPC